MKFDFHVQEDHNIVNDYLVATFSYLFARQALNDKFNNSIYIYLKRHCSFGICSIQDETNAIRRNH